MSSSTSKRTTTAVVGLGISGLSCVRYLCESDDLVVIDDREAPANLAAARSLAKDAALFIGAHAHAPERWQGVDRVVLSPGVAVDDPLLAGSDALERVSDIDLFMSAAGAPVIGITGTNGKSTVTALVGHMLRELGLRVSVGGNLGEPALDLLADDAAADVYVLELSSFQLEHSGDLRLAAATVLNLSADHLDRHGDMESYGAIKQRIYKSAQLCVGNADDPATLPQVTAHLRTFGIAADADWSLVIAPEGEALARAGHIFARADDFLLTGQHNLLNLLAAFALVAELTLHGLPKFAGNEARYVAAAAGFVGLTHRAEFIRELDGVRYINDSKATNVGATIAALAGYKSGCASRSPRVLLLAGGQGKGADFEPLAAAAAGCVKHALVFGEDAQLLSAALSASTNVSLYDDFSAAVIAAQQLAGRGDTVLLAPACASFDMFASFSARGDRFRELVEALA